MCSTAMSRDGMQCRISNQELFANSFHGKTVENLRKQTNVRLIADLHKLVGAAGKATFKRSEIINSDLILVEIERSKIVLDKPIAIGFTILEYAKLVMFRFYYDCLLQKFCDKLQLCFTDTDRLVSSVVSKKTTCMPI